MKLAEDLLNMPPSSKLLLKTLEYEGILTQRELAAKTLLPDRTVRLALRHLLDKGYVKKKISIRDARQKYTRFPVDWTTYEDDCCRIRTASTVCDF